MPHGQGLEDLLADAEYRRTYQDEKLILEVTESISEAMKQADVSRAELAEALGKSRAFVTQILTGSRNLTLRTWAGALTALGFEARVSIARIAGIKRADFTYEMQPEVTPRIKSEIQCSAEFPNPPKRLRKNIAVAA
ncbi:MAG TPA: helix-turn-helix transcriptional regulator [Candidatus Polarisedimenticolia bacterium]|jgi:transcriptional regulator with XRE-family HTH domain|nr:helix-turn-helix transcriptional regulator [Nitrospirales bacterium]HEV8701828.1 helix-turn-helix transcriptional regulator [Candidatus Polarisedimenticolia bacterium]